MTDAPKQKKTEHVDKTHPVCQPQDFSKEEKAFIMAAEIVKKSLKERGE